LLDNKNRTNIYQEIKGSLNSTYPNFPISNPKIYKYKYINVPAFFRGNKVAFLKGRRQIRGVSAQRKVKTEIRRNKQEKCTEIYRKLHKEERHSLRLSKLLFEQQSAGS
jgi:hypothetical protein